METKAAPADGGQPVSTTAATTPDDKITAAPVVKTAVVPAKRPSVSKSVPKRKLSAAAIARANERQREEEELELKYGSQHVIHLFLPVSLCNLVVIATINTVQWYATDVTKDGIPLFYTPFTEETDDTGTKIWQAMANAGIIIGAVIVMTVLLIVAYKYRCYKLIHCWLAFASLMLLVICSALYLLEVFKHRNIPLDYVTMSFSIWNLAMMGMMAIHWKSPLLIQQGYLIVVSSLVALLLIKFMPDWTVWVLLAFISVWDLIAVLCPNGPLKLLVETAQERDEPLFPALIYSATVVYMVSGGRRSDQSGPADVESQADLDDGRENEQRDEVEESGGQGSVQETEAKEASDSEATKSEQDVEKGKEEMEETVGEEKEETVGEEAQSHTELKLKKKKKKHQKKASHKAPAVTDEVSTVIEVPTVTKAPPKKTTTVAKPKPKEPVAQEEDDDDEDDGVKLGLGDFIFYSVLVGRVSSYGDWPTTVACYVAVLIGLCFTLVLLAVFKKALPALPISIFFGLVFYFSCSAFVSPFVNAAAIRQIAI